MTSKETYGITKFDEQRYSQMIVDFILNNPGCTAEFIMKNELEKAEEEREIGRRRLFTILKKLKRKKVIMEKKSHKKARNKMLYVREDNPLYTVSKELKEFEELYPSLLKKVKGELEGWQSGKRLLKPKYSQYHGEPLYVAYELIFDTTLFLFDTMRLYTLRLAMVWSRTIEDKYTKELLNFTIFSKLYQMQIKISETVGDVTLGGQNAFISSVVTELDEIKERIQDALSRLDRYEIKKEIEPISNFVLKIISTEMARQRILSQSSTYKWKINPNDMEGLADGMAEDYTTSSSIQNDLDSIMSTEFDQMRGK
jgi:hypothetical protein